MSQRSRLAARQRPQSRNSSLRPWRFVTLFAVFLLIQFALLLAPFMRPGVDRFSQWLAHLSGSIIQVCGGSVTMQAAVLRSPVTGFAIEMKDGCNGVNVMILLWSGLLAFPASWAGGRSDFWRERC